MPSFMEIAGDHVRILRAKSLLKTLTYALNVLTGLYCSLNDFPMAFLTKLKSSKV